MPNLVEQLLQSFESEFRTAWRESEGHTSQPGNELRSAALKARMEQLRALTNADGVLIAFRAFPGARCLASAGDAPPVGSRVDSGIAKKCLETGRSVLCEDANADLRFKLLTSTSPSLRSAIAVPIFGQGSIVGFVEALSRRPCAFSADQIAHLERFAVWNATDQSGDLATLARKPSEPVPDFLPAPVEPKTSPNGAPTVLPEPLAEKRVPPEAWIAVAAILILVLLMIFGAVRHRATKTFSHSASSSWTEPRHGVGGVSRDSGLHAEGPSSPAGPSSENGQNVPRIGDSVTAVNLRSSKLLLALSRPLKAARCCTGSRTSAFTTAGPRRDST